MNEIIKQQILSIRESGVTNMFDVDRVQYEANKAEYAHFILTGEVDKKK